MSGAKPGNVISLLRFFFFELFFHKNLSLQVFLKSFVHLLLLVIAYFILFRPTSVSICEFSKSSDVFTIIAVCVTR